ncbi:hypothetical protein HN682_08080 [Candidatus Peregrinibacteria bacterium]|nr:hypothetical protein [Candidatus Peregrinibacteria bacterium]
MPIETLDDSQRVEDIASETVQLNFDNAGALGADAGEAAGTPVVGKLAQGTVLNELGDTPANYLDTSLAFTSTALTTEVELPNGYDGRDYVGAIEKLQSLTSGLSNGEYFVDYVHGTVYGVKASVQTSLTATSYKIPVRGGTASAVIGSVNSQGQYNLVQPTIVDGDFDDMQLDVNGNLRVTLATGLNFQDDNVEAFNAANANTTGMDTTFDADGDNTAQSVKGAAGNLYKIDIYNSNGAAAFVQVFDATTGAVTVGTTTPKYVFFVPSGGAYSGDLVAPMSFATAITYACTTTATGNGDPTTGLTCSFGYK